MRQSFNNTEGAVEYYKEQEPKGECVLVIEGKSRQEQIEEERAEMGRNVHSGTYGLLYGSGD